MRRSIHRSIFRYLQKTWNAVMKNDSEWLERNDNHMALYPVNMAWSKISLSWRLAYSGRLISMLGSVLSILVYNEQLWSFYQVSVTRGYHTLLIPLNAQHHLLSMNISFWHWQTWFTWQYPCLLSVGDDFQQHFFKNESKEAKLLNIIKNVMCTSEFNLKYWIL